MISLEKQISLEKHEEDLSFPSSSANVESVTQHTTLHTAPGYSNVSHCINKGPSIDHGSGIPEGTADFERCEGSSKLLRHSAGMITSKKVPPKEQILCNPLIFSVLLSFSSS